MPLDSETDQSENEDLRLLALVMLAEIELEQRAEEVRLCAMAGCSADETRAFLRMGEGAEN